MKRHKVAIISDWYLPRIGGLELHIRDLARELSARGHEAHVITATPGPPASAQPAQADGVRVHRLDVPLMPRVKTIRGSRPVALLEDLLLRERFDIVHCHTFLSPLAQAGAYLARKHGIPSVLTEHSVLRDTGVSVLRALNRLVGFAEWPTILTAVSHFVAEDLRAVSGREDIEVLINGVRTLDWRRERQEPAEPRVISVMRFTKRKRPLDIIRAIPLVLERLPPRLSPRFTIVGDGPERERVEREAGRLGVSRYLELPGFRQRPEIQEFFARSSFFVLPSFKEALPISVLEARAAGLPVVARKPNGVSEMIEHGRHGFLAGDLPDFAERIAQLIADRELRQEMSRNAGSSLERFSWDRVIERHREIYQLATVRCQLGARRATSVGALDLLQAGGELELLQSRLRNAG